MKELIQAKLKNQNLDNFIILISCVSKKLNGCHEAYKLYSPSALFKAHWNYALKCLGGNPMDNIYIISAKHGLISPLEKIEKYNVTLKTMNREQKQEWAEKVIQDLSKKYNLNKTLVIILAGKDYYGYLLPELPYYMLIPKQPMPIGKRVQWFQKQNQTCKK